MADDKAVILPQKPAIVVSLDDLMQTKEAISAAEEKDRSQLLTLVNVDETQLRSKLYSWAASDFANSYVLYEIQLSSKCSDGVQRGCMEYITYLGTSFDPVATLNILQERLPGMVLSYSYTNDYKFRVHVSKTA